MPPVSGLVKINVDAVFLPSKNEAGLGAVIRDDMARFCYVQQRVLILSQISLFAERNLIRLLIALERLGVPGTMSSLSRELVFLFLQFLDEENFKETVHKLVNGMNLSVTYADNRYSMKIFFEIRKQKYLEALDRQNEQLSKYGDTKSARNIMLHQLCKNPRLNPDIKTLFTDHSCSPTTNGAHSPPPNLTNNPLVGPIPKAGAFPPIGAHGPFQPVVSPSSSAIAGWMSSGNPSLPHAAAVAAAPPGLVQPSSVSFSGIAHTPNVYSQDDLPKTVLRALNQGTNVMSMDFHPQQQTILLGSRERLVHKPFKVWDISSASMPLQTTLLNDAVISVNRCVWAPDGLMLGVALSKHIVQIYHYSPNGEIDAHVGGVHDIAFAHPNKQLCIVTCDDDKTIKFIFSTAIDGKIKAWLYDCLGSRVDYDAPGLWCTTMAYSTDGTRLFSCGTSKDAVDADGGLPASPRLRFNKEGLLLAVTTSDNGIKILGNSDGSRLIRMLESRGIDKSQGPSEPVNSKPLIVNALGPMGNAAIAPALEHPDRVPHVVSIDNLGTMDSSRLVDVKPRISEETDKIEGWRIPDIIDPSHLKALQLPDAITSGKVVRLLYTNSGLALLALAFNAVHKLWKWQRSERNPSGKPPSGTHMTNDISDTKPAEESAAYIASSKNDSYVMSASGGKVSLFNMMTFKVMTTFMSPPPAATFLAFHPQDNNIIAIGMEDSTIQIYNVRVDEVKTTLKGHQNRITGLAFSQTLNSLVSSGVGAQLCVWSIDGWEKKKLRFIQAPAGRQSPLAGETKVQFHNDQTHLLVVHESQIAIYDSKLECLRSWAPKDSLSAPISSGIYSCDGSLIYAGFCDGAVGVLDSDNLRLRCRIAASSYIHSFFVSNSAFAVVIAAHPSEPNQIALGMSDGTVHVVEPYDVDLKWGTTPSQENGSLPSSSSNLSLSGQPTKLPSR
ncbi:hypothetical protein CCACVL1_02292 [Corchorus capsularis]|uniref:CTLH domain-containing protein n=1 Tax=Corchorus capsularis TaxID=210143 RepID=A0A1R3K9J0_COCAP|nr:hypothetical protein CCACVL1_02292 [Corchorus capsularis]